MWTQSWRFERSKGHSHSVLDRHRHSEPEIVRGQIDSISDETQKGIMWQSAMREIHEQAIG